MPEKHDNNSKDAMAEQARRKKEQWLRFLDMRPADFQELLITHWDKTPRELKYNFLSFLCEIRSAFFIYRCTLQNLLKERLSERARGQVEIAFGMDELLSADPGELEDALPAFRQRAQERLREVFGKIPQETVRSDIFSKN